MATIEWALACESAFLDRRERLSVIGVATHFPVPSLPVAITEMMLVARLNDVQNGDEMRVGVAISTPRGRWVRPGADAFDVEQAGKYLLVTLRDVPLTDPGLYRFAIGLGSQEAVVEVSVVLQAPTHARMDVH